MIQKMIILAALVAVVAHAQADTVQIKIAGESAPIALPFNQRLAAWTKVYGVGYHNSDIAARFLAGGDVLQLRHRITQSREIGRFRIRNRLFRKFGRRRIALNRRELLEDRS